MNLIDSRYKIQSILKDGLDNISYKVIDLWNEDKALFMNVYNTERQSKVIDYFIDNFIHLCKIRHKYLFKNYQFNIIKTINRKRTTIKQYYITTEYNDRLSLDKIYLKLNLNERLSIVLQIATIL